MNKPETVLTDEDVTALVGNVADIGGSIRIARAIEQAVLAKLEQRQEPVAWIQPDHLEKAMLAPHLCRVEPTQRIADFVPLYTRPPTDTSLLEVAEKALDALQKTMVVWGGSCAWHKDVKEAIDALRPAIEAYKKG